MFVSVVDGMVIVFLSFLLDFESDKLFLEFKCQDGFLDLIISSFFTGLDVGDREGFNFY